MTAWWQEGAKKREVRERIAEVKSGSSEMSLVQVFKNIGAAFDSQEWRELLHWEGRMEELLAGQSDDVSNFILRAFSLAHGLVAVTFTGRDDNSGSVVRLETRRVDLLGKMELFRDQAQAMCQCGQALVCLRKFQEAKTWFQRARDVGVAHGFFSAECRACMGLGSLSKRDGRIEEGLDLLRNALVCPQPQSLHPTPHTVNRKS
jgi:hypothetical protein